MFNGIVQAVKPVVKVISKKPDLKMQVLKPTNLAFRHIKLGDSVAVDGVCLTVEKLSSKIMQFHISLQTLQTTGWKKHTFKNYFVNLEAPLKMNSTLSGHLISGQVHGIAKLVRVHKNHQQGSNILELKIPQPFKDFFFHKGFISLNGVSLTINKVKNNTFFVCLVPETIKRSNLLHPPLLSKTFTFEVDSLTHTIVSSIKNSVKTIKKVK